MDRKKRKNLIYHIVCCAFLVSSLLCSIFVFPKVFWRFLDSVIDVGTSCAYYVMNMVSMFGGDNPIEPTVIQIPENAVSLLPWTWEEFCLKIEEFGHALISETNFAGFLIAVSDVLFWVSIAIMFLAPLVLLLFLISLINGSNINNDYNKDTVPLKVFKWISAHTYRPAKAWAIGLIEFVKERKRYWIPILVLWIYNLNFATIALEVIAYLVYFVAAFDVLHIYTQVAKLALDLSVALFTVPVWILIIVGWFIFDYIRIKIAKAGRRAREEVNKSFVKTLSILVLIVGTTGKKKTTILADISLTKEVEFREQALSAVETNQLKFPYFPWVNLEKTIERAEKKHSIYNWASCRRFIRLLYATWKLKGERMAYFKDCVRRLRKKYGYDYQNLLFDYDVRAYGMKFDNSLYIEDIFETLEAYAQEYYLYRMRTSLIAGNLPVRSRIKWKDEGNFPEMDADFFDRNSRDIPRESQYSHIVDNDWFRLGKLYKPHNPQAGALEFGVVDFDEWAKDRGNQITNKGYSQDDELANPLNDEFNLDMKTRRQSAMVENEVYLTMIGTEQRVSSMNSDLLELCDILDIGDSFKFSIGIPFYHVELLLNEIMQGIYSKWQKKERVNHGNNTLMKHIVNSIYNAWWRLYLRRLNEFGYFKGILKRKLSGTDGKIVNAVYYLQFKKIYAKTFASDTFGAYYQTKAEFSSIGLNDITMYAGVRQTIEEMSQQGSYYVEKLNATFGRGQRRDEVKYDSEAEEKAQKTETLVKTINAQRKQIATQEYAFNSQKELVTKLQAEVAELREAARIAAQEPRSGEAEAKTKKAKPTTKM